MRRKYSRLPKLRGLVTDGLRWGGPVPVAGDTLHPERPRRLPGKVQDEQGYASPSRPVEQRFLAD